MKITSRVLIFLCMVISLFFINSSTAHAATYSKKYMIHDQLNLLKPSQKQQIIQQNQQWQHEGNKPQIWVYTLNRRPSDVGNLGEDLLTKIAKKATPKNGDYDWETKVDSKAQVWGIHVSLLVAYPGKGTQIKLIKSEDLDGATSDFQNWQLHRGLSTKIVNKNIAYQYFNRFSPFINKHIANVKTMKPGISWGDIWAVILTPMVLWLIIKLIRWLHNTPTSGGSGDSSFDDGYILGRWSR
ncbi:hypothetical protein [Lentilactobacillus hilgardii]|nr:hypothetical protein [Lentilactobacillus hilgardii]KRK58996.1 hypothetical protein FD42_GL001410 [Lentilactobacillus hilgardii DSM 20176 = ATCC 8290]TDG81418.1 hypothetical protein C5L34_002470 [Lentilactobacillus hilgardii]